MQVVAELHTSATLPGARPLLPTTAAQVRERWLSQVTKRTGIDFASWRPELGIEHNRDTIRASYRYYANLFLAHPFFEWAAMANAIAPTFAAAFDDLGVINRQLGKYGAWLGRLPAPIRDSLGGALNVAALPIRQFRHLETTLLSMQREIFVDQATMHEAYLGGGLAAIRELQQVGLIDDHARRAWELLDAGRTRGQAELVSQANAALLWREQMQIVADDYDELRTWGRTSPLLTYVLTAIGRPAVPGSRTPTQFDPIVVGGVRLPLPGMDISRRDQRWHMTIRDTLPAFQRLLTGTPDALRALIASDLDARIAAAQLRRLPDDASARDLARLLGGLRSQYGRVPDHIAVPPAGSVTS